MYSIDQVNDNKTDIQVVKGDTFRETITILDDARLAYIPCAGDVITFQVFRKYTDDEPIYEKDIPYDTLLLELIAKETKKMKIGSYVYVIKLERHNGDVDSFVHGKFEVKGMIE